MLEFLIYMKEKASNKFIDILRIKCKITIKSN